VRGKDSPTGESSNASEARSLHSGLPIKVNAQKGDVRVDLSAAGKSPPYPHLKQKGTLRLQLRASSPTRVSIAPGRLAPREAGNVEAGTDV
jgi:hypothetical protein